MMAYEFLLLTLVASFSGGCMAQNCRNSPLWFFLNADDIRPVLQDIQDSLVLIADGQPRRILTVPELAASSVFVLEEIVELPLVWCIQNTDLEEIRYSISVVSQDREAVSDPELTIPVEGTITRAPYRFRFIFRCLPSNRRTSTTMIFTLNSTSPTGEEFCPIRFYFGKRCSGSLLEADEVPTGLAVLGIIDGYLNTSNLTVKSTTSADIATKIIAQSSEAVLPKVLKGVLIPLSIIIIITSIVVIAVWATWYRRSRVKLADFKLEAVGLAYQETHASWKNNEEHEKEFSLQKLTIVRELGEGAFGVVSQAKAEGIIEGVPLTDVAVKQLHAGSNEVDNFFREVDFMSNLDHPNIVKLLGVCSKEEPYSMIFEYMDLGDLSSFLRQAIGLGENFENQGEDDVLNEPLLTNPELLRIILQVAQGMVYISSKNLVHRDLAARNCLVATGLLVKIADFGMSRNIDTTDYYRVKGSAMLPVRWMPPESVLYGKFTVESDIWAFGILLWEVFTFGKQPYFGHQNEEVIERIKEGRHPDPPPDCPTHQLMLQCWNRNPKKRPSFDKCRIKIEEILNSDAFN